MNLIGDDFDWNAWRTSPEIAKVQSAGDFVEDVVAAFYAEEQARGARSPWRKADDKLRFRPAEVSVWAGVNGEGKSLITSQIAKQLGQDGQRCLLASFEMTPAATLQRMCRQSWAGDLPTVEYIRQFHRWTDRWLWIYNHMGNCPPDKVLAVLRYAVTALGVSHCFIDSFMKLDIAPDDYNRQKRIAGEFCSLAMSTGMHIHLVAHATKGDAARRDLVKRDVKGAGEIIDQVDNVFLIRRNKEKERSIDQDKATPEIMAEPDCSILVDKNRHGDFEGYIKLWYDRRSQSYVGSPHEEVRRVDVNIDDLVDL